MIRVGAAFVILSANAALAYTALNGFIGQPGTPEMNFICKPFNFQGLLGYQFGFLHGSRSELNSFLTGWSVVAIISEHHKGL